MHAPPRNGLSVVELTVAVALAATLLTVSIETIGVLAASERKAQRRSIALLAADNLLEAFTARPWDEMTPQQAARLELDEATRAALPAAQLRVDVDSLDDDPRNGPPAARRIAVRIDWQDDAGQPARPVRLVAWAHRGGDAGRNSGENSP